MMVNLTLFLSMKMTILVLELTANEIDFTELYASLFGAQDEKLGWRSSSTSPTICGRRKQITVLKKDMSKKSSSWLKGWTKQSSGRHDDQTTDGDRQSS